MFNGLREDGDVGCLVGNGKWLLKVDMFAGEWTKFVLLRKEIVQLNITASFVKKIGNVSAACREVDYALALEVGVARSILLEEFYGIVT